MARFDFYSKPDGPGYLVDVQSDLMDHLATRMVVPLLPISKSPPAQKRLNLVFEINAERHVFLTHLMCVVPEPDLKLAQGNLSDHKESIERAIHMVFYGF